MHWSRFARNEQCMLLCGLGGLAVLAFAWLAFMQGQTGGFQFDDYSNLGGLYSLNADVSLYNLLQYVLNGVSSSLGRPLSLLTFAAQHGSWDQHPEDFVRANVLLHLLNGALWWWLVLRLQRLGAIPRAGWLPVMACALWLLLPVQGSAVLYIVQRMTVLATTFMLIGLLLYVAGRDAQSRGQDGGYWQMSAGVGIGLVLGTLAKENAALLPLLILGLEATLLRHVPRSSSWAGWSAVFLWLPTAIFTAYLVIRFPAFLAEYAWRGFTPAERLLTETRVLWMYLGQSFVPSFAGVRILYDDLALSQSLWQPWTTALALALWICVVGAAIWLRRTAPLFAFAVAWYLTGHLLESTFIPLELAFDHRNYLPTLGPVLALSAGLAHLASAPSARRLRLLITLTVTAYLISLGGGVWLSAGLWGRALDQAHYWAQQQPDSRRALHHYGAMLVKHRQGVNAAAVYRVALTRWQSDPFAALALSERACFDSAVTVDLPDLQRRLNGYRGGDTAAALSVLERLVRHSENGRCRYLAPRQILGIIEMTLASPQFEPRRHLLHYLGALLLYAEGDREQALVWMERALALQIQIPLLQYAVLWSVEQGDTKAAWRYLALAESGLHIPKRERWTYREEIRGMRDLVELYAPPP